MLKLIKNYPQLLLFGILTAMFSGPGQTFLVSFFLPPMRETFDLSQTEISGLYGLATLASAMLLPGVGYLLDRIRLVWFTLTAGALMTLGCLVLSVSANIGTIFIGFLLVRNLGQGTLTMVSSTTMAKAFGPKRGKALGISNLGYPLGEAMFPWIVTTFILAHGWRNGWVLLAGLTTLFFLPAVFILVRHYDDLHAIREKHEKEVKELPPHVSRVHWKLPEVLRDVRFYLLQIPVLLVPAFLTMLFFHQAALMEWKGWDLQLIAVAFVVFAICRGLISFSVGALIDKFSAVRIFPPALIPMAIGILCLQHGQDPIWGFAYLGFVGLTMGLGMTLSGAFWAELYGTKWLGSIKGMQSALVVFSTAISPPILGWMLDNQVDLSKVMTVLIWITLASALLAYFTLKIPPYKSST